MSEWVQAGAPCCPGQNIGPVGLLKQEERSDLTLTSFLGPWARAHRHLSNKNRLGYTSDLQSDRWRVFTKNQLLNFSFLKALLNRHERSVFAVALASHLR